MKKTLKIIVPILCTMKIFVLCSEAQEEKSLIITQHSSTNSTEVFKPPYTLKLSELEYSNASEAYVIRKTATTLPEIKELIELYRLKNGDVFIEYENYKNKFAIQRPGSHEGYYNRLNKFCEEIHGGEFVYH